MRSFQFIILTVFMVLSCAWSSAQIKIVPRGELEAKANPRLSADSASVRFDTRQIVAEPINEKDGPVRFHYRMCNVGDRPLQIRRMVSTCSCAVPVSDRKVLSPGDTAVITVTYHPEGHPGKFERRIFVYTQDGNSPVAVLKLNVTVKESQDFSGLYRYRKGTVQLRRDQVVFSAGTSGMERIPFVNLSGKDLKLDCDRVMLPECLEFQTEPQILKDRQEGEIIIRFNPNVGQVRENMLIILKGVGASPSESSIKVKVSDNKN